MNRVAQGLAIGKGLAEGFIKVLDKGKPDTLKSAIGSSEELLGSIEPKKGKKLTKFLGKLGKLAPFLGALGAAASLIGLFGPSPEVQRLDHVIDLVNDGFQRMEKRFGKLEEKIANAEEAIKVEITKNHFWTRVLPHMNKLSHAEEKVKRYFRVTGAARKSRKTDLGLDEYDNVHSAIHGIRDSFTGKHRAKLCKDVRSFAAESKKMVLTISVDLFSRIIKGASYLDLIGTLLGRGDVDQTRKDMEKILITVWEEIEKCDTDIEEGWMSQWRRDLKNEFLDKERK